MSTVRPIGPTYGNVLKWLFGRLPGMGQALVCADDRWTGLLLCLKRRTHKRCWKCLVHCAGHPHHWPWCRSWLCFSHFRKNPPIFRCYNSASYPSWDGKWVVAYRLRGEGLVWLIGAVVCLLAANRGSNCLLSWAIDVRIVRCGIISSCQSAATCPEIVKRFCLEFVTGVR